MQFKYSAKNSKGELQAGLIKAVNQSAALVALSGHGLFVVELEEVKEEQGGVSILGFLHRIKIVDIMVFTRQLATLLGAKIPLSDAIKTLFQQTTNDQLKTIISAVSEDVETGFTLSQSLGKHPQAFSEFYVNMVRSAEITGRMEEVMNYLADYLEKSTGLATRVRNALIYPVFIIVLFGGVSLFLVTFILPQLRPIFEDAGVTLPLFTRILMGTGAFLASWWWAVLIVLVILGVAGVDYIKTKEGKAMMDSVQLKIPILGKMFRQLYIARFSDSASVLIKGGIPIAQAIEITARTIGNSLYEAVLMEAAQAIRRGDLISSALSRYDDYFPPLTYQMIAVGETTGRLEEILARISQFYTREVDSLTTNLVELIQPLLIVGIGVAVGALFGSIILPMFKLAQSY